MFQEIANFITEYKYIIMPILVWVFIQLFKFIYDGDIKSFSSKKPSFISFFSFNLLSFYYDFSHTSSLLYFIIFIFIYIIFYVFCLVFSLFMFTCCLLVFSISFALFPLFSGSYPQVIFVSFCCLFQFYVSFLF